MKALALVIALTECAGATVESVAPEARLPSGNASDAAERVVPGAVMTQLVIAAEKESVAIAPRKHLLKI